MNYIDCLRGQINHGNRIPERYWNADLSSAEILLDIISANVEEAERDFWTGDINSFIDFDPEEQEIMLRVCGPHFTRDDGVQDCYSVRISIIDALEDFAEEEATFSQAQRDSLKIRIARMRDIAEKLNSFIDKAEYRLNQSTT